VTDAQVRACVLDNLIRYDPPERAVIVQYLDIEGACRARLEGAPEAQVSVVPLEDQAGAGAGTSAPRTGGATSPGAPDDPGADDGGATGGRVGSDVPAATAPSGPRAADKTALPAVRVALQRSDVGRVASPTAAADAPAWVILLVVAALVAVVGCGWMEVQRRRR
jgi:hypothetical protein